MPGLTPRDMNGHEYDRGPRGPYSGMNGSADPYREEFYRDDPYRRDDGAEEMYRRVVKNGRPMNDRFGSDYMQDQGRPMENRDVVTFEVDHLATFQSNEPNGSLQPADGLRKLRYMENNAGIWTMRCIMSIERKFLVILDYSTGEELERFPITMVQDPTAIFKNDKREIYNNLILFSVMERRNAPTDMHIFQAISCPIGRCELKNQAQEIVDEILAAKEGRPRISGHRIPPPPLGPAPEPPGHARDAYEFREYRAMGGAGFIGGGPPRNVINRTRDSDGLIANEVLERDVQLLNHCFDDVEKFVARLQQAAEAYRELEKRKKDRKGRKKQPGEGMLSHRARPPPANDFIDIFRKFKLSFNLLAKLKAHIHDPNAPELVHFLFTPLSLIYEASRDPVHGNQNLADQAVAPVLTAEAKQLLLNCLTSKEQDMWQNLGRNWTTSREEWKGPVPQYSPQFYDGWIPPRMVDDVITTPRTDPGLEPAVMAHGAHMRARSMEVIEKRSFPHEEERFGMDGRYSDSRFDDFRRNDFDRTPRPPSPRNPIPVSQPRVPVYPEYTEQRSYPRQEPSPTPTAPRPRNRQEENQAFALRLKQKGAEVHEVLHDRQGKNAKELTVQKGDVLEVLDRSRNWWKVRNYRDEEGFAPYTILKELKSQELEERLPGQGEPRDRSSGVYTTQLLERSSGVYNTHIQERHTPPIAVPAPPPAPSPTAALLASEAAGRRNQRREEERIPTPPAARERPPPSAQRPSPRANDVSYMNVPREKERRERTPHDDLHDELRAKMSGSSSNPPPLLRPRPPPPTSPPSPHPGRSPSGCSSRASVPSDCVEMYGYYDGRQLLATSKGELERRLSPNEAAKLDDTLSLQRDRCGVQPRKENAELTSILHRRKAALDTETRQDSHLGVPPSFRPLTPSSIDDDSNSEGSANDLANTGKTLRDLLIRQRKKIVNKEVFQDH